jgi:hypothetical protein
LGLLLQQGGQDPFQKPLGGGLGGLLEGEQIDVQTRALVPEGLTGDDSAPAVREITEMREVLG